MYVQFTSCVYGEGMHLIKNAKPTVVKVEYMSKPCTDRRIKSVLIVNDIEFFSHYVWNCH